MARNANEDKNKQKEQERCTPGISQKQLDIEKLEQLGYKNISLDSVPMFKIETKDDWNTIKSVIGNKYSFGVKGHVQV